MGTRIIFQSLVKAKGAYAFLIHACDVRRGFFWQNVSQEEGFYDVFRAKVVFWSNLCQVQANGSCDESFDGFCSWFGNP